MNPKPLTAFLLSASLACHAQRDSTVTTDARPWQQYLSQLSDYDDVETNNLDDLYEQMSELEASPIDLNSATDEDIRQLSFLSSEQMEQLAEYLDRYRPLRSLGELAMLQSIDPLRLQLLRCFVYIGEERREKAFPKPKDIIRYGKHELTASAQIPFYERKGDRNGYLGYKYKHWFRYRYSCGQYVQIGLTGTQDAGEPFFAAGNNMGYDHYAYYAMVRRLGALKCLALGQYKLRFGLGLVMNNGFSLGKTSAMTMSTPTFAVTPNSSRSDARYMQGAAATVSISRHVDATAFFSYRYIDATLDKDGAIKTILKTGYHRTASELQRKHNAAQTAAGANVRWHSGGWHAGATGIVTTFDRPLNPDKNQLFRLYNPTGKTFYNASADYGYTSHNLTANGETAINDMGAVATLNSVSLKASSDLTLTAIQRFYSYRYYSLFSSSFSDKGSIQNESGVYIGASWSPLPRVSIIAYTDYAYFPWLNYRTSQPSHSWDNMMQIAYMPSHRTSINARYRIRLRQEDCNTDDNSGKLLIDKTEHRARLSLAYAGNRLNAKTQLDAAYTAFPAAATDKHDSFGWMATQTIGYDNKTVSAAANIAYFHTRDYNSRLYVYERTTLYTFSFPMFYGRGMHGAVFVRANVCPSLALIGKVSTTKYFDRNTIASSYQLINSSWKTDMDVQVRWKF